MKGIEKITARIEQDANADIAAQMKAAEEKAAAIRSQYEAQAREETAKAAENAEKAALQLVERAESAARMEKFIQSVSKG